MKNNYISFLYLLVFVFFANVSFAQISVTNSTFPKIGDTLSTRAILSFEGVDLSEAGADLFWNFESIAVGNRNTVIYLDPSEGSGAANFMDAELMASQGGIEIYYDVYNNRIDELGRGGQDFGFGDLGIPLRYEKNPVFRRSPIDFGDVYDSESIASIAISADIIPDSILGQAGALIDSLRVDLDINNSVSVDSWGTITVPGGTSYEVLREKVNTVQTTKLFVNSAVLTGGTWLEASGALLASIGELAAFFGEQHSTSYNFYSATEKEIIASFTQDDSGAFTNGSVIGGPIAVNTKQLTYTANEIKAYPNPSLGPITFDVGAFGNGDYTLTIFNIVGKQIHSDSFTISSYDGHKANLSHLRKGTYIYTINNSKGDKLATKRFIILKP